MIDYSARDNWHEISTPTYLMHAWEGEPRTLVLGVAMLPEVEQASIEQGAAGEYDAHFRRLGQLLVDHGREDTILRVGWEFNLSASPWFTEDAAAFREYWRRIVHAMSVPGSDFVFDWNPNNGVTPVDAVDYYPGDDVVDVIGVDAYDHYGVGTYPYPDACDDACRTSVQQHVWDESTYGGDHGLRFWSSFARKHGKPLSLPEWGLWDKPNGTGGGDDPVYLRNMHDFVSDPVNNVLYQAYFEFNGIDGEHRLMTTFAGTGHMYRELMATGR